jgi:CheY-like chemotaxis protein
VPILRTQDFVAGHFQNRADKVENYFFIVSNENGFRLDSLIVRQPWMRRALVETGPLRSGASKVCSPHGDGRRVFTVFFQELPSIGCAFACSRIGRPDNRMLDSRIRETVCLIVDDEPAIREYIGVILQRKGIRSIEAESAIEALRILHQIRGQVDLLISDIQMPGDMDGVDLAHSIKDSFPTLPVILISGYADRVPAGFAFVQKPFMPEKISEAVTRLLIRPRA